MLVTCPQCRRSIEVPNVGLSSAIPLSVCPCCGKFAARVETPESTATPTGKSGLTWLPPVKKYAPSV
jgi:hypothetical protein